MATVQIFITKFFTRTKQWELGVFFFFLSNAKSRCINIFKSLFSHIFIRNDGKRNARCQWHSALFFFLDSFSNSLLILIKLTICRDLQALILEFTNVIKTISHFMLLFIYYTIPKMVHSFWQHFGMSFLVLKPTLLILYHFLRSTVVHSRLISVMEVLPFDRDK